MKRAFLCLSILVMAGLILPQDVKDDPPPPEAERSIVSEARRPSKSNVPRPGSHGRIITLRAPPRFAAYSRIASLPISRPSPATISMVAASGGLC